jgi:hypothetical protein
VHDNSSKIPCNKTDTRDGSHKDNLTKEFGQRRFFSEKILMKKSTNLSILSNACDQQKEI